MSVSLNSAIVGLLQNTDEGRVDVINNLEADLNADSTSDVGYTSGVQNGEIDTVESFKAMQQLGNLTRVEGVALEAGQGSKETGQKVEQKVG